MSKPNGITGIISQRKSAAMPGITIGSNTKSPTMNLSFKGESPS